jgi:cytochrome d ubiquinol oxidase subunit I
MVGLGSLGALFSLWYLVVLLWRRRLPSSVWFYRVAACCGVGAYAALEAGWVTTEVGRQPWIVYGTMRVSDAVTDAPAAYLWAMLSALVVVYAVIAAFFFVLLRRLTLRWRSEDSGAAPVARAADVPYGPRSVTD